MDAENKAKLLAFADWIEHNKRCYNQTDFSTCVAAHAKAFRLGLRDTADVRAGEDDLLAVGVPLGEVGAVCFPAANQRFCGSYDDLTKADIAAGLRRLAQTGAYTLDATEE